MKKILLIVLMLVSFGANAQTPKTVSNPMTGHYYKFYGFAQIDSGLIMGGRDTFWTPKQPILILDSNTYLIAYYNGARWSEWGGSSTVPNIKAVLDVGHNAGGDSLTKVLFDGSQNTVVNIANSALAHPSIGVTSSSAYLTVSGAGLWVLGGSYFINLDTSNIHTYHYYQSVFQQLENQRLSSTNNVTFNTLNLTTQSSVPSVPTSGFVLFANSVNALSWEKWDGYVRSISMPYAGNENLIAERKASYTIADSADVVNAGLIATNVPNSYITAYKTIVLLNTDSIAQGSSNKFFTQTLARASLSATGSGGSYNSTTGLITFNANGTDSTILAGFGLLRTVSAKQITIFADTSILVAKTFLSAQSYIKLISLSVTNTGTGAATYNNTTGVFNIPNLTGTFWSLTGNTAVPRTKGLFTTDTSRLYLGTYSSKLGLLNYVDSTNRLVWGDTAKSTFPAQTTWDVVGLIKCGPNFIAGSQVNASTQAISTIGIINAQGGLDVSNPRNAAAGFTGFALSGLNLGIFQSGVVVTQFSSVGNLGGGNLSLLTYSNAPSLSHSGVADNINGYLATFTIGGGGAGLPNSNLTAYNQFNATLSFDGSTSAFTTGMLTGYRCGNPTYLHNVTAFRAFSAVNAAGSTQWAFYDSLAQNYFGGQTLIGTLGSPDVSAILDLESTTKGFLIPQMSATQIAAISTPKNSLLTFNTTSSFLNIYNSTTSVSNELIPCTSGSHINGQIGMFNSTTNTYTVGFPVITGGGIRTGAGADTIYMTASPTLFTQTTSNTISSTTSETVMTGAGIGTDTIPANYIVQGKVITATMAGVLTMPAITAGTIIVKVYYGSTVIATGTANSFLAGSTNSSFSGVVRFTCQSGGTTGTGVIDGSFNYSTGNNTAKNSLDLNNGGAQLTGIDFTPKKRLYLTLTPSLTTISVKTNNYLLTAQN